MSHDLHDVMDVATRVVVMRGGRTIGGGPTAALSHDEVVAMIVGGGNPSGGQDR